MTDSFTDYYYWGIDLPGMTGLEASSLLDLAKANRLAASGSLIDPSAFLTLHMDLGTVEILLAALRSLIAAGLPADDKVFAAGARSMVEEFENWKRTAAASALKSSE